MATIDRQTWLDNTKETIQNLVAERLAVSAYPKPFYIVNEQAISAADYRRFLTEEITKLQEQLQMLEGPWEIRELKRPV